MTSTSIASLFTALSWQPVSKAEFAQLTPDEQLKRIRHSSAHVLASAVQMIRPGVQFATGPATPTGFFYDMHFSAEHDDAQPLGEADLALLENTMRAIANRAAAFEVAQIEKSKAIELFQALNQPHKIEILERIEAPVITLYRHTLPPSADNQNDPGNRYFVDLCAGPHVPHTGLCKFAKPLTLSGAHWRGEEKPTLTRVAGTAWANDKDLNQYLKFLEASKNRDHRTLGPQLDLFSFHPWAMAPLWHPNGFILRQQLANFWREMTEAGGYVEIFNPLLYRKALYETSGHWDHFRENMFIFEGRQENDHAGCDHEQADQTIALKPMNCPDTMLYFKSSLRSYRDLPMRVAEGQILHRNEASGAIHGLMRTRSFIQDDAHLFLAPEHVQSEVASLLAMIDTTYRAFDLEYSLKLSTRPENYMGELAVWNQAEAGLKQALDNLGKPYDLDPGEGAFYGPKIDVYVLDSLGRQWQCGTVQLDFQLPERFELKYADADGSLKQPIVVHRAVFGSFERFIGILIEHVGGLFPTWLAPVQAAVLPIGEAQSGYAQAVMKALKDSKIRAVLMADGTLNARIRQAETQKIPHLLVLGAREAEQETVTARKSRQGGNQQVFTLAEFMEHINELVSRRVFDVTLERFDDLFRKPAAHLSTEDADY
ncbi:MAG: threonine--tRNA ligase [Vampirovibrionales bacterium]|nr:threonine--tRNA ligase [Vampirovibrionales bacterium]